MRTLSDSPWRELFRCDDFRQASAVATSIAAMEFDVQLRSTEPRSSPHTAAGAFDDPYADDWERTQRGPFIIEVSPQHWQPLRDLLDEIVQEQVEFDALLEGRVVRNRKYILVVIGATTIAELTIIWHLLRA